MGAGKFSRPYTWLQRTIEIDELGQAIESYTEKQTLFGQHKELSASKKLAFGVLNSQVDCEIHIRQYPAIDAKDRLRDKDSDYLLIIDGITLDYDNNETIIYAHKLTE